MPSIVCWLRKIFVRNFAGRFCNISYQVWGIEKGHRVPGSGHAMHRNRLVHRYVAIVPIAITGNFSYVSIKQSSILDVSKTFSAMKIPWKIGVDRWLLWSASCHRSSTSQGAWAMRLPCVWWIALAAWWHPQHGKLTIRHRFRCTTRTWSILWQPCPI